MISFKDMQGKMAERVSISQVMDELTISLNEYLDEEMMSWFRNSEDDAKIFTEDNVKCFVYDWNYNHPHKHISLSKVNKGILYQKIQDIATEAGYRVSRPSFSEISLELFNPQTDESEFNRFKAFYKSIPWLKETKPSLERNGMDFSACFTWDKPREYSLYGEDEELYISLWRFPSSFFPSSGMKLFNNFADITTYWRRIADRFLQYEELRPLALQIQEQYPNPKDSI